MKKKLWQTTNNLNKLIEEYTSGSDLFIDQHLVEFDVLGSIAHSEMLAEEGLIEQADLVEIKNGLTEILAAYHKGQFNLSLGDEDVHTKVENELSKKFSVAGAKLHLGRSRNDQVLVDLRLYSKNKLQLLKGKLLQVANVFCLQAQKYQNLPLVGLTHMQPAMLSSFGLWLGSFAESLLDDLKVVEVAVELNDQSPLGSGAAYGVTLPLNRQSVAHKLKFKQVQNNALYCQNSKGKIEATTLFAMTQVMATLNKFASDCLLFTTDPFSFISFDSQLSTGSSIMPQKKNWDGLEIMRANYHQLIAAQNLVSSSQANLPSGYNRDSQLVKKQLIDGFAITLSSLDVVELFVNSLVINLDQVKKHLPKEIFAAHWAYLLVKEKSIPFRHAYLYVKENLDLIPDFDPEELLPLAISQGSTGNLQLSELSKQIAEYQRRRD